MPERVFINESLQFIEVVSFGVVSKKDLENALSDILELSEKHDISVVLVDVSSQEELLSPKEYLDFIESIPSFLRIAIFSVEWSKTRTMQQEGESIARTSQKNYKLFYNREEAVDWLLKDAF